MGKVTVLSLPLLVRPHWAVYLPMANQWWEMPLDEPIDIFVVVIL